MSYTILWVVRRSAVAHSSRGRPPTGLPATTATTATTDTTATTTTTTTATTTTTNNNNNDNDNNGNHNNNDTNDRPGQAKPRGAAPTKAGPTPKTGATRVAEIDWSAMVSNE